MSEEIAEILAKCTERLESGASLESCLADYPKETAELEPLLRMTQQMNELTKVVPRAAFARNTRAQLENQVAASRKSVTLKRPILNTRQETKILRQTRYGGMSVSKFVVATILALSATTGITAYAANASNPGDSLHGLDLAMENIQLNLTPDVVSKVQLRLEFASERLAEAQATFSKNDVADGLEAMNEYGTQISDIAQLIGSSDGADQEALDSLLETAQSVHVAELTKLLDTAPDQAKESIQKAIEASDSPGKPDDVGNPNGADNPANSGHSNGPGNPNDPTGSDNSNGNGAGNPNPPGGPPRTPPGKP